MGHSAKVENSLKSHPHIPGWGSDLKPSRRPGVPKEKAPPHGTGAHWTKPEQQKPTVKIHQSIEHRGLTPVFGTTCPPKGLSGTLRNIAYQWSEGRTAHWMVLLLADRIDVLENRFLDLMRGKLFNPITESGLPAEWKRNGFQSRYGKRRADVKRIRNEGLLLVGLTAGVWFLFKSLNKRTK